MQNNEVNKSKNKFPRKKIKGDRISIEARSFLMSKIRSENTGLEIFFISYLKKKIKNKFITHDHSIRGNPDVVYKNRKLCIFIDSDFWHGWQYPKWKDGLKNDFWRRKIEKNRMRDRTITAYLRRNGWKVVRIWEHEIGKDLEKTINKVTDLLTD